MKIEVRNVRFGATALHQETLNFVADVYADGTKIGLATNNGHGGMTNVSPYDYSNKDGFNKAVEYAKGLPPIVYPKSQYMDEFSIPSTLENVVDELVNSIYNQKEADRFMRTLKKKMINHIIIGNPDKLDSYGQIKFQFDIKQKVVDEKARAYIDGVSKTLRREIPKLKEGEVVINDYLQPLVEQIKSELLTDKK